VLAFGIFLKMEEDMHQCVLLYGEH